jgi:Ca2+/H+ antiporter
VASTMLLVLVYVYVVVPPSAFKYKMWQEFCERFVHLVSCVFLVLYLDA